MLKTPYHSQIVTLRVSIGVEATERHHVEALWNLVRETAALVDGQWRAMR